MKRDFYYLKWIVRNPKGSEDDLNEDLLKVLKNWCWVRSFSDPAWKMYLYKQHNREVYYCVALGKTASTFDVDPAHMSPDERRGLIEIQFEDLVKRINNPEATRPYEESKANLASNGKV